MDKRYIVNRQGRDFVLYEGLLNEAHQHGLKRITTMLIQIPTPENGNVAICHAEVETDAGIYSGIGDASPGNVNKMILPAIIRMCETRAKARALRDAVNIGATALEELGDGEESGPGTQHHAAPVPIRETVSVDGDLRQRVNDQINALADATGTSLADLVPTVMADARVSGKNSKTMTDAERQRVLDVIETRLASLALSSEEEPASVPAEGKTF